MRSPSVALTILVGLVACSDNSSPASHDAAAASGTGASGGSGATSGGNGGGAANASTAGSGGRGVDDDAGVVSGPTGIIDGGWVVPDELQLCDGPCACADGIDNDGDGVADGFDTECTGPNDDDEGTFATGIPGDNRDPKWQDCFFDGNSGAGDDDCRYATECLTGELPQDDPDCTLTEQCIEFCAPRTPNGCDCFGCCTFTLADGSEKSVVIEAGCEAERLDDCTECAPTTECGNTCGRCELCLGKSADLLPADCFTPPPSGGAGGTGGTGGSGGSGGSSGSGGSGGDEPPPFTCDGPEPRCVDTSDCPDGRYCSFGCCLVIVI